MWGDYLMIAKLHAGLDAWENLAWTARGKKFKTVVEFTVILAFVFVGSLEIK
jgi:hypothetical protein